MRCKKILYKSAKIAGNVILYLFVAVCLMGLVLSIVSKKDSDGAATILGYQIRFVQSPSMEKCDQTDLSIYPDVKIKDIPVRSAVLIKTVPTDPERAAAWYEELREGDVLTFKYVYTTQETITHRLVGKQLNERGGYTLSLEGDNKASDANTLAQTIDTSLTNSPNYVIGKVVATSLPLGLLVMALKNPVGIVCIVMVPALIIIVLEIIRIVSILGAEKQKKQKQAQAEQQNEIDELKRQLELLQQQAGTPTSEGVSEIQNQQEQE